MQVQFHAGTFAEAVLTATPAEFDAMAGRVAGLATAGGEARFAASGGNVAAVVVRIGSGPIVIGVVGGVLSISGDPEAIAGFGQSLPIEPTLPPGYHIHFEHAGHEGWVAAQSVPLVLMVGNEPTLVRDLA